MIKCCLGDEEYQHADSEIENMTLLEAFTIELQDVGKRAIYVIVNQANMQINHNQKSGFLKSVVSDYADKLSTEHRLSDASIIMNTLSANSWVQHDRAELYLGWDLSEQKSGRRKSDYQRDLFSDSRRYCLHEWRVLYCVKHVVEFRPSWFCCASPVSRAFLS